MNTYPRKAANSAIWRIDLYDSSSAINALLTGVTFSSTGLVIEVQRELDAAKTSYSSAGSTTETITTLGAYAAPTATKIQFKETQLAGVYELHPAETLSGTGDGSRYVDVKIYGATNCVPRLVRLWLTGADMQDAVHLGASALPNVAAGANGGLPLGDANARVDVGHWIGTAVTLSSSLPDVNTKTITAGIIAAGTFAANALDAVWSTATRTLTTYSDSAGITTLLTRIASALTIVGGKAAATVASGDFADLLAARALKIDNLDATVSSRTKPADTQAAVTLVATTTNLTNAPTAGDLTAAMKTSVTTAATAATPTAAAVTAKVAATVATGDMTDLPALRAAKIDHLDADTTSRLATTSYTAPDNAGIATAEASAASAAASASTAAAQSTAAASSAASADTKASTIITDIVALHGNVATTDDLDARGLTTSGGVTRIAGHDLRDAGTGDQLIGS